MATWVDELGALVAERVAGPVVILGHSMGTILALEAWAAWPERIRGLIFVGGVPQVAPRIRERLSDRVHALEGARRPDGLGQEGLAGRLLAEHVSRSARSRRPRSSGCSKRKQSRPTSVPAGSCSAANAEAIAGTVHRAVPGDHRRTRSVRAARSRRGIPAPHSRRAAARGHPRAAAICPSSSSPTRSRPP